MAQLLYHASMFPKNVTGKQLSGSQSYHQEDNEVAMPHLVATGIATILEDSALQLRILSANKPQCEELQFDHRPFLQRVKSWQKMDTLFDPETKLPTEEALEMKKEVKQQQDRAFAVKLLGLALEEMANDGTWKILKMCMEQEARKVEEEDGLKLEEQHNREQIKVLKVSLKAREEALQEVSNRYLILATLKDQMEDAVFHGEVLMRYTQHWEEARRDQNSLEISDVETLLHDSVVSNALECELENRVNVEVIECLAGASTKLEGQIAVWLERYNSEMDQRDSALAILKANREEDFERMQELALQYKNRQEEISEYLEVVAERERILAEQKFLHNKATKIQAWWRGTMVRRCLGHFKPEKKKAEKGKVKGKQK